MILKTNKIMRPLVASVFAILFGTQVQSSLSSNELNLHLCTHNKTVTVQILTGLQDNMSCECQAGPSIDPNIRDDYFHTPGIGSHKLHTVAKSWNEARQICKEEKAHLAIINSKAEEKVLLDMMRKAKLQINAEHTRDQAYLGIHDLFKEGEWLTIFGESIYSTGYAEWSTNWYVPQPDNAGRNGENCGTLVLNGGMNDIACHTPLAFFCETALSCSG